MNVFAGVGSVNDVLDALPAEIEATARQRSMLAHDAQARLWWDETPVDIFLSNHPFHGSVEERRRIVPFGDLEHLPVLACADLAVFKTFFNRPKDRLDVAMMVAAGTVPLDSLGTAVRRLLGSDRDRFLEQVAELVREMSE